MEGVRAPPEPTSTRSPNAGEKPSRSKDELQPKLNLARRRHCARDDSPVGRNHAFTGCVDARERNPAARYGEVRMIGQVKHLAAKLESALLVDGERLRQRKIEIDKTRSSHCISAQIATLSRGLQRECVDIPVAVGTP